MIPKKPTTLLTLLATFAYASGSCEDEMQGYKDESAVIKGFNATALVPEIESLDDMNEYCVFEPSLTCTAEFPELLGAYQAECDKLGGTYVTYDIGATDGCTFSDFMLPMSLKGINIPLCLGPSCDAAVEGDAFAAEFDEGLVEFGVVGCTSEITAVRVGGPSDDSGAVSLRGASLSALFIAISVALLS